MKRFLRLAVIVLGAPIALLIFSEGSTSLYMFVQDYRAAQAPRGNSRPHTTYDTLLGWVNKPSYVSADEYGKGIVLSTNALGFRGSEPVVLTDTARTRLVCSGDSFTLGYGVTDDKNWCHLLEAQFPGLQTLDMGQGAYGLDQAYLWYRRDGVRVPHKVTVFSMTDVEFERSITDSYQGRFKPILAFENGAVQIRNVPVPQQTDDALKRAYAGRLLNDLRIMQVIRKFPAFDGSSAGANLVNDRWSVFEGVFASLDTLSKRAGSTLVLVYLPNRRDVPQGALDARRAKIAASAAKQGIRFVDLTPALRAMRKDSLDLAFISKSLPQSAPGVPGHYSNLGNAWIANQLAVQLRDVPALAHLTTNVAHHPDSKRH